MIANCLLMIFLYSSSCEHEKNKLMKLMGSQMSFSNCQMLARFAFSSSRRSTSGRPALGAVGVVVVTVLAVVVTRGPESVDRLTSRFLSLVSLVRVVVVAVIVVVMEHEMVAIMDDSVVTVAVTALDIDTGWTPVLTNVSPARC